MPPRRFFPLVGLFLLVFIPFYLYSSPIMPYSWFSYATRPLWDHSPEPNQAIAHQLEPLGGAEEWSQRCQAHGWRPRDQEVDVWDATLFSTELDLLLLRLHELSPLVSHFFILESRTTFTGAPKPILLEAALQTPSFVPFRDQIVYDIWDGRALREGEHAFAVENEMRARLSETIKQKMAGMERVPLLLQSDVDELPSKEAVSLLKACEFEPPLHLELKEYLYSFEFPLGDDEGQSWRAAMVQWPNRGSGEDEFYRHGKITERILKNAGWHCSWCFPRLSDFITKATGYSHSDRLGPRPASILAPARVQKVICEGSDFFDMLPEAYSWHEMRDKWRVLRKGNSEGLPRGLGVKEEQKRFRYLLPGGCVRDSE